MTHHFTADLARVYITRRLSDAEAARAGRRMAIELRRGRRQAAQARAEQLATTEATLTKARGAWWLNPARARPR